MIREAACTCGSDSRCPHDIQQKLAQESDELELLVDRMISRFPRSTLKEYLDHHDRDRDHSYRAPISVYASKHQLKEGTQRDGNLPHISSLKSKFISRPHTADSASYSKNYPRVAEAWGTSGKSTTGKTNQKSKNVKKVKRQNQPSSQKKGELDQSGDIAGSWGNEETAILLDTLPSEMSVGISLNHVVDTYVRKILPWQSMFCRKAIESLRDSRAVKMNQIYDNFLTNMAEKLNDKVEQFLNTKQNEIDHWGEKEISIWEEQLNNLVGVIEHSLRADVSRQIEREGSQKSAQAWRDLSLTTAIEAIEKENTQQQLQEAKRLCNSEKKVDSRMLQITLSSAHARADAQQFVFARSVVKNQEAAHDWLRCVADNAITASMIETQMKGIVKEFQCEKNNVFDQFKQTKILFDEQCEKMLASIHQFCETVVSQAHDHLDRERLIFRGFLLHLKDIKAPRNDRFEDEDNEKLQCQFRSERNEKLLIKKRLAMIRIFQEKQEQLCQKVQHQYQQATEKLLNNIRDRDGLVETYLTNINLTFRKFVQVSCNKRRHILTRNITQRKNFFYFEDECITEISSLLANLRFDMGGIWRKEHLVALHLTQSIMDRLETASAAHFEVMKNSYLNMSCNLEGEKSNIAWVHDSEVILKLKVEERKFAMKQFRRKVTLDWNSLLDEGTNKIHEIMSTISTLLTQVNSDILRHRGEKDLDDPWDQVFVHLQSEFDSITKQFILHHQNRFEKEKAILLFTFNTQKDYVEKTWKENIMAMNSTLLQEVKSFFRTYCRVKDELTDMCLQHEIEMQCFEQAALMRFEEHWKNVLKQNQKFSIELIHTLLNIIANMEPVEAQRGSATRNRSEEESSHFYLFRRLQNVDSRKSNCSEVNCQDIPPLDGVPIEGVEMASTDDFGSPKFNVDTIDFDKLFLSSNPSGMDIRTNSNPPMVYIECIHHVVATIPVSRFRHFLKHIKNELRSLPTRQLNYTPPSFSYVNGLFSDIRNSPMSSRILNLQTYDQHLLQTVSNFGTRSSPNFSLSVNLTFQMLQQNGLHFVRTSNLIPQFLSLLARYNADTLVSDQLLLTLEQVLSISFAANIISEVAVFEQLVDLLQVYEYLRLNIKQLFAFGLHLVGVLLHSDRMKPQTRKGEETIHLEWNVSLPACLGLSEMIECESSWLLASLELDDAVHPSGMNDDLDHRTQATQHQIKVETLGNYCPQSRSIMPIFDRLINLQHSREHSSDGYSTDQTYTGTPSFVSKMLSANISDSDICVYLSLLNIDTVPSDPIFDVSTSSLQVACRVWRTIAFCRLHYLALHSEYVTKQQIFQVSPSDHSPLTEFDTIETILGRHDSYILQELPKAENGEIKVYCRSSFDCIDDLIKHFSSLPGLPLSFLQTLTVLSSSCGSLSDPWITEPTHYVHHLQLQTLSYSFIDFFLNGLLWTFWKRAQDVRSVVSPSQNLVPSFEDDTYDQLKYFNSGTPDDCIPYESLREYCRNDQSIDVKEYYNQIQLTMRFWCAFRMDLQTEAELRVNSRQSDPQIRKQKRAALSRDHTKSSNEYDSPFPLGFLESLPPPSRIIDDERGYRSNTQSVIDLLEIGDTVDSFTDTIGEISDPSSSFLSSSYSELIGIITTPLEPEVRRHTLINSLDFEISMHQPIQGNINIWCQRHTFLSAEKTQHLLKPTTHRKNYHPYPKGTPLLVDHYPSYAELKKRIELSLLFQLAGDITRHQMIVSNNDSLIHQTYDSDVDSGQMAEYWKYLSYNRLNRIKDFTKSIRSVMSDNWTEMIFDFRKERYLHRAQTTIRAFDQFKKYMKGYREETLNQRAILKDLYSSIIKQIHSNNVADTEAMNDIHSFYAYGNQLFIDSLQSLLAGYKTSKIAFLKANWMVYERNKLIVENLHQQCYDALCASSSIQNDTYRLNTIGRHFDLVKASSGAGFSRYQTTTDSIAKAKNKFLTTISKSWKEVNEEVAKSLSHFERLLGDLLIRWYDHEKSFQLLIKRQKMDLFSSIKEVIDQIQTTIKENTGKVYEFYKNIEGSILTEIFEPVPLRIGTNASDHQESSGADSPSKFMLSKTPSNDDSVSFRQKMARKLSREPLLRSPGQGNLLRVISQDELAHTSESLRHSPSDADTSSSLVTPIMKLRDKIRLHVTTIGKLVKSERYRFMTAIKEFRQKRNLHLAELREKADEIRTTWSTIRSDLLNNINIYIAEAREHQAILSVDMRNISTQYRVHDRHRVSDLRETILLEIYRAMRRDLLQNDEDDGSIFYKFDDRIEDVLVAMNKELNETDHQPAPLRTFIRDIETRPLVVLDSLRDIAFNLYRKYPFEDDLIYQFLQTAEQFSLCLDNMKKSCHGIMDEYLRDKRDTYKRLQLISKCEVVLDCKPQVRNVLDMIVNTIEAEDSIKHELNDQEKKIAIRSKSLEQSIVSFLQANTFPESLLNHQEELPNEDEIIELYGPCKLNTSHHHHGVCNNCVATLFSTISRNDLIVNGKLDALATHVSVMSSREEEIDKAHYFELFDRFDTLQQSLLEDLPTSRLKILSQLDGKCQEKDPSFKSNPMCSRYLRILEQVSESSILEEIFSVKDRAFFEQTEIMASLMRRVQMVLKENPPVPTQTQDSNKSEFQQSAKSAFYGGKAHGSRELHTILSLSPNPTADSGDGGDWIRRAVSGDAPESDLYPKMKQSIDFPLPEETHSKVDSSNEAEETQSDSQLPSFSCFISPKDDNRSDQSDDVQVVDRDVDSNIRTRDGIDSILSEERWDFSPDGHTKRRHERVPVLPLRQFMVNELEDSSLPLGWEKKIDETGSTSYYNTLSGETSSFHPSFILANNWRRCFTSEGLEYYYNDVTGKKSWEAPNEAFEDDDTFICTFSSDVAREYELLRSQQNPSGPSPPIPEDALPIKISQVSDIPQKTPSVFSSSREKEYSINVLEEGYQSFESVGNMSYDSLLAKTIAGPEERYVKAQTSLEEILDTFSNLYSNMNQSQHQDEERAVNDFETANEETLDSSSFEEKLDQPPLVVSDPDFDRPNNHQSFEFHDSSAPSPSDEILQEPISEPVKESEQSVEEEIISTEHQSDNIRGSSADPFANNSAAWIRRIDAYGMEYFENTISGETTWERPSNIDVNVPIQTIPEQNLSDPASWQMYFTDTGIPYYFNSSTGESRWTAPAGLHETDDLIIRSYSATGLKDSDLTPLHSSRDKQFDRGQGFSLENNESGDFDDSNPYLIDLMDFMPSTTKNRRFPQTDLL